MGLQKIKGKDIEIHARNLTDVAHKKERKKKLMLHLNVKKNLKKCLIFVTLKNIFRFGLTYFTEASFARNFQKNEILLGVFKHGVKMHFF